MDPNNKEDNVEFSLESDIADNHHDAYTADSEGNGAIAPASMDDNPLGTFAHTDARSSSDDNSSIEEDNETSSTDLQPLNRLDSEGSSRFNSLGADFELLDSDSELDSFEVLSRQTHKNADDEQLGRPLPVIARRQGTPLITIADGEAPQETVIGEPVGTDSSVSTDEVDSEGSTESVVGEYSSTSSSSSSDADLESGIPDINSNGRIREFLAYLNFLARDDQKTHPQRIILDAFKLLVSMGVSLTTAIAVCDVAGAISQGYSTATVHRLENDFAEYLVPGIAIPVQILLALYFADPVPDSWKQQIAAVMQNTAAMLPTALGSALDAVRDADSFELVLANLNGFNATDFFVPMSMNIITLMYWLINDLPWGTPLYSNGLGYTAIGFSLLIGLLTALQSYYQSYNAAHPHADESLLNRIVTSRPSEAFTAFTNAASFLRPITFDVMRMLGVQNLAAVTPFAIRTAVITAAGLGGSAVFIATSGNPNGLVRAGYSWSLTVLSSLLQTYNYEKQIFNTSTQDGPSLIAKFVEGITPGVLATIVLAMFLAMILKRFCSPAPSTNSELGEMYSRPRANRGLLLSNSSSWYGTGGQRSLGSELTSPINDGDEFNGEVARRIKND